MEKRIGEVYAPICSISTLLRLDSHVTVATRVEVVPRSMQGSLAQPVSGSSSTGQRQGWRSESGEASTPSSLLIRAA